MPVALAVRDLTVTGDGGATLLSVPRFDAHGGQVIAIRGPSGAGKSTFLFALAGLAPGLSGQIYWDEDDIVAARSGARARLRAERLGFIFQDHLLFDELGLDANAAVATLFRPADERRTIARRATDTLIRLGLTPGDRRRVPSYSGGERQRIAVARALATDPDALLADEPTAHLDRTAAEALTADLTALARERQKLLVVVSHDPAIIAAADRVCVIEHGTFREEGRLAEVPQARPAGR